MNRVMKYVKLWFPVIVWAGLIFYFSSKPRISSGLEDVDVGLLDLMLRKLVHISEYLILTILFHRALKGSFELKASKLLFFSLIFSVIYASLDEFHQTFVPTRTGSVYDVLVDSMGVVIAYIILRCGKGNLRLKFGASKS